MLFQDLQNLVASLLDDPNQTYFTPQQVGVWLNNAQKEVQKLLIEAGDNYYLKCVTTQNVVIGQQCLELPADFLKLHRIETVDNLGTTAEKKFVIMPITLNQQDFVIQLQGRPENYVLKRSQLLFYPATDLLYNFRMYYSYRVIDMVLPTDAPDVPEEYHEFIAIVAAIDGRLKDDRMTDALMAKRVYYENMLKNMARNRNVDKPRMVVMTSDEGFGTFI